MIRILGIDPGSRVTGFGIIESQAQRVSYLTCGGIQTQTVSMPLRLQEIYVGISRVIAEYHPTILAIEQVFMSRNVASALKLGQARGVAIVAAVQQNLTVYEYSPNQIKQAVVGRGHAHKEQVQHMVRVLLSLSATPSVDAADALAVALCHAYVNQSAQQLSKLASR